MTCVALLLAFACLLQADSAEPHIKAAQAAYDAGRQAETSKQFARAAECFTTAIEIEPTFLDPREALIATYLQADQRLTAAAAITQLLEIQPEAAKYRILLGQILLEQKEPMKALAQFSLVLKRDPNSIEGLLGFAAAANEAGLKERASAVLERGRKLYPSDQRFHAVRSKSQE